MAWKHLKKPLEIITLSMAALTLSTIELSAGEFGAGIILGEPTGITPKYFINQKAAVDAGISYSFREHFHFYGDFLWHFPSGLKTFADELENLTPYLGIGGGARITSRSQKQDRSKAYAYGRFPAGLEWQFQDPNLGVFGEVAIGMAVVPQVFAMVQGGLGIRYYFR